MTSLPLTNYPRPVTKPIPEWGTGKLQSSVDLWTPRAPTWHASGTPNIQFYGLTKLKLSKVRESDQLVPNALRIDMCAEDTPLLFPAEHPLHTHTSRFAVIPNFESAEDPETGSKARQCFPKTARMPASPYDYMVLEKTGGFPRRHEVVAVVTESNKIPQAWIPGDIHDKSSKRSDHPPVQKYPAPIKTYVPTVTIRDDSMAGTRVSDRTANVLANIERHHKMTVSELSYTGMGSTNPMKLDNMKDKERQMAAMGGEVDTSLRPRSWPTFDPARQYDGRKEKTITPKPPLPSAIHEHPEPERTWGRTMTLSEKEEHRLWFGKKHANFPEGYLPQRPITAPDHQCLPQEFWTDGELKLGDESEKYPYHEHSPHNQQLHLLENLQREQNYRRQQMEADNRFRLLDSQTPAHNMAVLRRKSALAASTNSLPHIFYNHENNYLRERAGLYNTSYDPYILKGAMNADKMRGAVVMDTTDSHVGALDVPTPLSALAANAMRYNRTLGGPPGCVPQLNTRQSLYEIYAPFDLQKDMQSTHIQPNAITSDVHTQDGGLIQRQTVYGCGFNTHKFLQERQLPQSLRKEPLVVMSHSNQRLNRVRPLTSARCARNPQEGDYESWQLPAEDRQLRPQQSDEDRPICSDQEPNIGRDCCKADALPPQHDIENQTQYLAPTDSVPAIGTYPTERAILAAKTRIAEAQNAATGQKGIDLEKSWCNRYAKQCRLPPCVPYDYSSKTDERFNWKAGQGERQPQTSLSYIQDTFTESDAIKNFCKDFPENHPDLRDNKHFGRKHVFEGVNLQMLR